MNEPRWLDEIRARSWLPYYVGMTDQGAVDAQDDCDTLVEYVNELRAALVAAKVGHIDCEDSYYSCWKADGSGPVRSCKGLSKCNCGADEHNAAIDAVLNRETPPDVRM